MLVIHPLSEGGDQLQDAGVHCRALQSMDTLRVMQRWAMTFAMQLQRRWTCKSHLSIRPDCLQHPSGHGTSLLVAKLLLWLPLGASLLVD